MERKALITVLVCVMAVTAIFTGSAGAAWYTTNVTQAGAAPYGYFITGQDPTSFPTATTFVIDRSQGEGKAILASALTAVATSGSVYIYVDTPTAYSTCWAVYANK